MLNRIVNHAVGVVDGRIQEYVAGRYRSLVVGLIEGAVRNWRAEGFLRFGDGEVDCTIRLYDWCDRIIRLDRTKWPAVRVQYDGALPTRAMRIGLADPKRTPRPDLVLFIGKLDVHVEAKRLAASGGLPKLYVDQGIRRFLDKAYGWGRDSRGVMIAYHMADSPDDGFAAVNMQIRANSELGEPHCIEQIEVLLPELLILESAHGLPFKLMHFSLDIRARDVGHQLA